MGKWIAISKAEYHWWKKEVLYKAFAGGRMLGGGVYTEWTPHSALNPHAPDLRSEQRGNVNKTERRYFSMY